MLRRLTALLIRFRVWVFIGAIVWFAVWFVSHGLTTETQVTKRKEQFRQALQEKNVRKALSMVSHGYRDQWGFSREDVGNAFRDVTSQFLTVQLEFRDEQLTERSGEIDFSARLRLNGQPLTPVGTMMSTQANQHREPFTFTWRKEGWWPWSWKLVTTASPELELPANYQPGMFSAGSTSFEDIARRILSGSEVTPPPDRQPAE